MLRHSLVRRLMCLALALAAALWIVQAGPDGLGSLVRLYFGTPHERYAAALKLGDEGSTPAARAWLDAGDLSLKSPTRVTGKAEPRRMTLVEGEPTASTFVITVKRGQRLTAAARLDPAAAAAPFIDVFERDRFALRHVAHAAPGATIVGVEARADTEYLVRIQPELLQTGTLVIEVQTDPTLRIPVDGATAKSVQSFFGASRDGGRRTHDGVDIFAARGTPVRAAASGIVTSVGPNGLGGNTIWITRPTRGESHYYAHLDRQLVAAGTFVNEGDVIGLVGNTGNARTTAPHLHFGIYTARGAVDPLPYIAEQGSSRKAQVTSHKARSPAGSG